MPEEVGKHLYKCNERTNLQLHVLYHTRFASCLKVTAMISSICFSWKRTVITLLRKVFYRYISPQEKGNDGGGMEILENIKHSIKYKQLFKQYYIRMYILTVLERNAIEP